MVAYGSNAHQDMMELWHDVGRSSWELVEEEIERHGGAVWRVTCCSNEDLERAWVDIHAGGVGGEVVAFDAGVGYCGILREKERVWGGATGIGRRTRFSS